MSYPAGKLADVPVAASAVSKHSSNITARVIQQSRYYLDQNTKVMFVI